MRFGSSQQFVWALVLTVPFLQNCSKARYEQVRATAAPVPFAQPVPPQREPMGPMDVQPAPRRRPPLHDRLPDRHSGENSDDRNRPLDDDSSRDQHYPLPPVGSSGESGDDRVEPDSNVTTESEPTPFPPQRPSEIVQATPWFSPAHALPAVPERPPQPPPRQPEPPRPPEPRPEPPVPPCEPDQNCYQGNYKQPTEDVTNKLDVLFVIDTSPSIYQERERAALGIERFVSQLPQGVSYNIGVIPAHSPVHGNAGKLIQIGNEAVVLKSEGMGLNEIKSALHTKLTKMKTDGSSDGGELGIYSLSHAITGDQLVRNREHGMFRPDAALAIIFISDENDICSIGHVPTGNYPAGVDWKLDVNMHDAVRTDEIYAWDTFCTPESITAKSVYEKLLRLKAEDSTVRSAGSKPVAKPLLISAIVYTQTPTEAEGRARGDKWEQENERGYGYLEMVEMNGNSIGAGGIKGVAVDIGRDDIAGGLERIGRAARAKLALKTEFPIHPGPRDGSVDGASVRVWVDGSELINTPKNKLFQFDANTQQVNLFAPGGPGSMVRIYWCAERIRDRQCRAH